MKKSVFGLLSLMMSLLIPTTVFAHGDHIYFKSPTAMQHVSGVVTFQLNAPYSNIPVVHLNIAGKGADKAAVKYFLNLNEDKTYSQDIDVSSWNAGEYCAEVTQLGAVHTHETSVCFSVN